MACEDCDRARRSTEYRVFCPACLWCGARYLQLLKAWPPPRDIGGRPETTKERQEWRSKVLKDWADFGHDPERLRDLAAGEKVPFEPVEGRRADAQDSAQDGERGKRAGALARKAPPRQGGARSDRVAAEVEAAAAAAGGSDHD